MAKTNLQIKAKNVATDASITTTLTYVNPEANSATLKTFGQKLNAFTTNNYVETDRVQTINVDTETVPIVPTPATLTLTPQTSYTIQSGYVKIPFTDFTYTGSGTINEIFGVRTKQGTIGGIRECYNDGTALTFPADSAGTYNLRLGIPGATELENVIEDFQVTVS